MKYIYYIITEYMILYLINPLNVVSILPYLIFMFYQTILPSAERLSSKSAGLYCMHINVYFCCLMLFNIVKFLHGMKILFDILLIVSYAMFCKGYTLSIGHSCNLIRFRTGRFFCDFVCLRGRGILNGKIVFGMIVLFCLNI